jgi:cell wall-associated NlpC family hydrolase
VIARTRIFRSRAPVVVWVALVAILASPLAVTPAYGDALADKRAEAKRLAAEIDSLGQRVSILAEDLDSARLAADSLKARVATATRDLAEAEQQASGAKAVLSDAAVSTYMNGGVQLGATDLTGAADVDPLLRRQYAMTIEGRRVDALDAMRAQLQVLTRKRASLADAQKQAAGAVASVEKAQRDSEAASQREAAVLARVQGDLVQLVQQEEQRRAAEDAANAQKALQRAEAQARQDAARRASTPAAAPGAATPAPGRPRPGPQPVAGPSTKPAPPPTNTPAPSSGAQAAIDEARRQIGKPYRYGGSGPDSFDCSGLTSWAWRAGGRSLPHSSRAQYSSLPHVPPSSAQPGDLFFYGSPVHHVGIYIGGGQMIEAPHSGTNVRQAGAYRSDLVGVGRP